MFRHHDKSPKFRDSFVAGKQGFAEPLPNLAVLVASGTARFEPLLPFTLLMPYMTTFYQLTEIQNAVDVARDSFTAQQKVVRGLRGTARVAAEDVLAGYGCALDELLVLSHQKRVLADFFKALASDLELARDLVAATVRDQLSAVK